MDLTRIIQEHGPIPAVRVSSAKSTKWSYWGVARYEVRLRVDGTPALFPLERAKSDRRSRALAVSDALEIADDEGRVLIEGSRGPLSREDYERVMEWLRTSTESCTTRSQIITS